MSIQFVQGQVAVSDPMPGGPTPLSNIKQVVTKVVKLSSANFATGNVDTMIAQLPADATIVRLSTWVKTQLAGNGIAAATLSLGSASGGTQFTSAVSVFGAAGVYTVLTPVTGIFQNYNVPLGTDIQLWARGTSTTGTPTSGEIYLMVEYIR